MTPMLVQNFFPFVLYLDIVMTLIHVRVNLGSLLGLIPFYMLLTEMFKGGAFRELYMRVFRG